ncbi:MAG TPA: ABC transporter ATP-binding protein [Rhabdochlamydiaceae bacterium]|nr:ABC transporter ATP-binding protein [Rhabdochlamydiaceae bacterium]
MNNPYKSLSSFLLHFTQPFRWQVAGLFLIGLIWAAYFSLSPTMIKLIIDAVSDYPDDLIAHALGPILGYLGIGVFLVGLSAAYDYLILKFTPPFKSAIIEKTHTYLQDHSYGFFQTHLAGSLSNKISDISKGASSILTSIIDDFFSRSLLFIFGVITLLWVHPLFALAMITWSILFFILSYLLAKKSEKYSIDFSEARSTVMGKVVDAISNIFNIKLFATKGYEHGYLRKHLGEMVGKEQRLHWYMLKLKLVQSFSITLLLMAMMGLLIYTRMQGLITVGDFALVLTLTTGIVDETFYLALQFVTFSEDVGVCKQALMILAKQPEAFDPPHASSLKVSEGKIVFEDVSFNYINGKPIFENLNLTISPGEKVGLVGLSGSGKSTLAHLLLRLYELSQGRILIDGHDISQVTRESLVRQIAMIPQDSILFHRTVQENIHYGKLDASEAEVIEAAKKAHCHSFILQMKEGYQTIVGERGMRLSGGQRQRLAIARAVLKNAPILILDEATSALDSFTEQKIQESLRYLMQDRTTLVIAHRLSTLHHMDRILVFEQGKIIEEGTHQELVDKEGRYAQLWRMQSGETPVKLPYFV